MQTNEKLLVKLYSLLGSLDLNLEFCGFFEQDSEFSLQRMDRLQKVCQARFRFPLATLGQLHGLLTTVTPFHHPLFERTRAVAV